MQAFDSILWEQELGLSISFLEREIVRFCSWMGGGEELAAPVCIYSHHPLNPKSSVFVFDPQIPQPQIKRLKVLFVQLKVELSMDPQLQSDPYDSSKQYMQYQHPVPRS